MTKTILPDAEGGGHQATVQRSGWSPNGDDTNRESIKSFRSRVIADYLGRMIPQKLLQAADCEVLILR